MRSIRTMRESRRDNGEGLATVGPGSALDDTHPMAMALIAVTLPIPVMAFPPITCGPVTRWSVRSRISQVRNAFAWSIVGLRRANRLKNSALVPVLTGFELSIGWPRHKQASHSRSHSPMSVELNLFTDRARGMPCAQIKNHKRRDGATKIARAAALRVAEYQSLRRYLRQRLVSNML
jgi:hypothetical protein